MRFGYNYICRVTTTSITGNFLRKKTRLRQHVQQKSQHIHVARSRKRKGLNSAILNGLMSETDSIRFQNSEPPRLAACDSNAVAISEFKRQSAIGKSVHNSARLKADKAKLSVRACRKWKQFEIRNRPFDPFSEIPLFPLHIDKKNQTCAIKICSRQKSIGIAERSTGRSQNISLAG